MILRRSKRGVDKKATARYAENKRPTHVRRPRLQAPHKQNLLHFSEKKLTEEILQEAKILRIHSGVAEIVARHVSANVAKWAKTRKQITAVELNTRVARELSVYDPDLAFLYQNRDKII